MYKKITGVDELTVRDRQRDAKQTMIEINEILKEKKNEYKQIKAQNEYERELLRKEQRQAQAFKFTKMSKKHSFKPTLKERGELQVEYVASHSNGCEYLSGKARDALLFPARVNDNARRFSQIRMHDSGGLFGKMIGQEAELYDEVLKKYMKSQERGVPKPHAPRNGAQHSTPVPSHNLLLPGTNGVFQTTTPHCRRLEQTMPMLLDRSNTPRSASRAVALDRNFSSKRWLYNKSTLDALDPAHSKKDLERSILIKKLQKKEDKLKSARLAKISGQNQQMRQTLMSDSDGAGNTLDTVTRRVSDIGVVKKSNLKGPSMMSITEQ